MKYVNSCSFFKYLSCGVCFYSILLLSFLALYIWLLVFTYGKVSFIIVCLMIGSCGVCLLGLILMMLNYELNVVIEAELDIIREKDLEEKKKVEQKERLARRIIEEEQHRIKLKNYLLSDYYYVKESNLLVTEIYQIPFDSSHYDYHYNYYPNKNFINMDDKYTITQYYNKDTNTLTIKVKDIESNRIFEKHYNNFIDTADNITITDTMLTTDV